MYFLFICRSTAAKKVSGTKYNIHVGVKTNTCTFPVKRNLVKMVNMKMARGSGTSSAVFEQNFQIKPVCDRLIAAFSWRVSTPLIESQDRWGVTYGTPGCYEQNMQLCIHEYIDNHNQESGSELMQSQVKITCTEAKKARFTLKG